MTVSKSFRQNLNVSVMFWTSVFLLFLVKGVYSSSEDRYQVYDRSPKYNSETDVVPGYMTPEAQENYNMMQFLHGLLQRQQQKSNNQLQTYNNGEEMSENPVDWRRLPLPLLYQIRALINDENKEEDKRGSRMFLCHFKVCNLG